MIYIFDALCILVGLLIAITIDSPKSFFAKWFVYPVVAIPIVPLGQAIYNTGVPTDTLFFSGILCALVGVVLYYLGQFLMVLSLYWFFRG